MKEKLASELLDASTNKGNAVKKRERYAQDGGRPTRPSPTIAGSLKANLRRVGSKTYIGQRRSGHGSQPERMS